MSDENSADVFEYFRPRKVLGISGDLQLAIVALLYGLITWMYFLEYKETGKVAGYNPGVSLLFVPIYEEMIFRGIFLKYFKTQYGNLQSILIVSILFGLWHFKNIFWLSSDALISQIAYTSLIFSPILAWITIKTRSIWPAVILHYLNNIPWHDLIN